MYHDCALPEPMELHLEFHPHRFITRFNAIQKELSSREVIYIEEDGEDEDVEGEDDGVEIIGDDNETHEDKQEAQDLAEKSPAGKHLTPKSTFELTLICIEHSQTETGQLPVPLPPAESVPNAGRSNLCLTYASMLTG